jgi:septation ring formation regulator EzrA
VWHLIVGPTELAPFFKEYGVYAVMAILCGVIVYLDRRVQAKELANSALLERVVSALGDAKAAHLANAASLSEVRETVEQVGDSLAALSSEFQKLSTDARHGMNNLQQGQSAIASLLEKIRDVLAGLPEKLRTAIFDLVNQGRS